MSGPDLQTEHCHAPPKWSYDGHLGFNPDGSDQFTSFKGRQAPQLIALGVLIDADAAGSAQLAFEAGLTVGACGQIIDLLFGQASLVFLIILII
ncbi:hypothetical protein JZ751_022630 [Albula glossodonta]|uniref:Uncharacterized protein n=1 Tax=Albula glossodonta TaxID=121402 RepID=A0A8T2PJN7_9TELE|nr:hypothetical protein JZ751_022630 [Albula glossodonta]